MVVSLGETGFVFGRNRWFCMPISPPITQYPLCARPWGQLSRGGLCKLCLFRKLPVKRKDVRDRCYDLELKACLPPSDIPGLSCTVTCEPGDYPLDVGPAPVIFLELGGVLPCLCLHAHPVSAGLTRDARDRACQVRMRQDTRIRAESGNQKSRSGLAVRGAAATRSPRTIRCSAPHPRP